jgi:hypothetical protein
MVLVCVKCSSDVDKDHTCILFLCGRILACRDSVYDLSEGTTSFEEGDPEPSLSLCPLLSVSRTKHNIFFGYSGYDLKRRFNHC